MTFLLREFISLCFESKLESGEVRVPLTRAEALAKHLIKSLGLKALMPDDVDSNTKFQPNVGIPSGSIRRRKPDIGDLDIIVTANVTKQDIEELPGARNVTGGAKQINFVYGSGDLARKVNLFVFLDPNTFGAAMLHVCGSGAYNMRIRYVTKQRGMKLSQNGLYDASGKLLPSRTEAEIQKALGITNREATQR